MTSQAEQQFLAEIYAVPKFGEGLGLLRVQKALELLVPSYPRFSFTPIVVTGSNGKGSTAHYTESLLRHVGRRTALFTSPHFLYFNERFRVNGERISYDELLISWHLLQKHLKVVETALNQKFGRFEVLFLLAVSTFEQYQVQVAVFEAGIGGRYDPTRLLQAPYNVLTSVDLEHKELLGHTLTEICYDKLDVCGNASRSFISATVPNTLLPQIRAYNKLRMVQTCEVANTWQVELKVLAPQRQSSDECQHSSENKLFCQPVTSVCVQNRKSVESGFQELTTVHSQQLLLNPVPQSANIAAAIAVTDAYLHDQNVKAVEHNPLLKKAIAQGLNNCVVAGRMQHIQQQPFPILIDAAHTPESFVHLFGALQQAYQDQSLVLIIGQSADKSIEPLLAGVQKLSDVADCELILTEPSCRAKSVSILQQAFSEAGFEHRATQNVREACALASEIALAKPQEQFCTVVVVGGLFLAAEAQVALQNLAIALSFD